MKISHHLPFLFLLLIPAAFSAPIAEESFPTEAGGYTLSPLVGQSPPAAGFTGSWLAAWNEAGSPNVIGTGLGYSDGTNAITVWRNPEDLKDEANSTIDGAVSNFDRASLNVLVLPKHYS